MDVVKETLNVAGLLTHVYSRSNLRDPSSNPHSSEPIVVLFFLHGKERCSDSVDDTARGAFAWVAERQASSSKQNPRDFVVVTFDQRNHGTRLVDERRNNSWNRKEEFHNDYHAIDMYGMILGAVKDISFLIDILPAFLFPHGERTIEEWALAGFSLGGHATWLALQHEPRIRIGIPISGCPDYLALIEYRASRVGVPPVPPCIPASLRALVRAQYHDPETVPSVFAGKSVLVLAGADDRVVPWSVYRAFVEALDVGPSGRKEVAVVNGVKHEFTDGMREEVFRFFWEEALVGRPASASAPLPAPAAVRGCAL